MATLGVRTKPVGFLFLASVGVGALLVVAIRMGALQMDREHTPEGQTAPDGTEPMAGPG